VIDQLEALAQSSGLMVYKTPSEEEPSTVNAFLNTDDFYFEVSINIRGEITDVKFSIFSEPAQVTHKTNMRRLFDDVFFYKYNKFNFFQSSHILKDVFCSWSWSRLYRHIDGIKQCFILSDPDQ
jgi:hypothetical protein